MSSAESVNSRTTLNGAKRPAEDETQTAKLYRSHGSWLLAWIRRQFGAQDAEDLAQEAFTQLIGSRTEVQNPKAFLMRLARDAAGMQARRRSSRPTLVSDEIRLAAASEAPDQEQGILLEQTILALPPKLRDVFVLNRIAGLTYDEIARRSGLSTKAVEARMSKALKICTALLDQ